MSVVFDGAADRVQLASAPVTLPTTITVIAWIKPAAFSTRDTIFCHYNTAPDDYLGPYTFTGGVLRFRSPWSTANGVWSSPAASIASGVWQAIAVTYNAGNVANTPAMYKKPEGGAFSTLSVGVTQAPSGTFDTPANQAWVGGVSVSYPFNGRIAYVRVFNSILTPTQIEAEMDSVSAILTAEFDLPLVADLNDDSGNGHNGTLGGNAALDADNPTLPGGGEEEGPPLLLLLSEPMEDVRQKDSTNQTYEVMFRDTATGAGKTGLAAASMDLKYHRAGSAAVAISENALGAIGAAHNDGGVFEIGGGLYRLDAPDAVQAAGADRVVIFGSATGAELVPLVIKLADYNPITEGADTSTLETAVADVDALVTVIAADVDNLQTRIPAALVGGRMDANVGAVTNDAITAASLAADVTTELQNGLATGTNLATANTKLDTLLGSDTGYKKGVAVAAFEFYMELTDGNPATGKVVTVQISKDGGAFATVAGAVTEIAAGWYKVDLTGTEMNADEVGFKATAAACKQRNLKIRTQS